MTICKGEIDEKAICQQVSIFTFFHQKVQHTALLACEKALNRRIVIRTWQIWVQELFVIYSFTPVEKVPKALEGKYCLGNMIIHHQILQQK